MGLPKENEKLDKMLQMHVKNVNQKILPTTKRDYLAVPSPTFRKHLDFSNLSTKQASPVLREGFHPGNSVSNTPMSYIPPPSTLSNSNNNCQKQTIESPIKQAPKKFIKLIKKVSLRSTYKSYKTKLLIIFKAILYFAFLAYVIIGERYVNRHCNGKSGILKSNCKKMKRDLKITIVLLSLATLYALTYIYKKFEKSSARFVIYKDSIALSIEMIYIRYTVQINFFICVLLVLFYPILYWILSKNEETNFKPNYWLSVRSAVGYITIPFILFVFSVHRKHIKYRQVLGGLFLQSYFGIFVLKSQLGQNILHVFTELVEAFLNYSNFGAGFVFNRLALEKIDGKNSFIFAFQVLTIIVFFAAFVRLLYHYGIMQSIVNKLGYLIYLVMGTSPPESIVAAGNIFIGQTEAPLMVKPYLDYCTKSELFAIMSAGLATVAGSVLGAYIKMGIDGTVLITASVMAAPCVLAFSKLFYPETEVSHFTNFKNLESEDTIEHVSESSNTYNTMASVNINQSDFGHKAVELVKIAEINTVADSCQIDSIQLSETPKKIQKNKIDLGQVKASNGIQALALGASDSINLIANIAVNLIVFVSLIHLVDGFLGFFGTLVGFENLTARLILSKLFWIVGYLLGVRVEDIDKVADLIGTKVVVNEFVAFATLGDMKTKFSELGCKQGWISKRSEAIVTMALCGFANVSSMGITMGGLSALAPKKSKIVGELIVKALFIGVIVSLQNAALTGILQFEPSEHYYWHDYEHEKPKCEVYCCYKDECDLDYDRWNSTFQNCDSNDCKTLSC